MNNPNEFFTPWHVAQKEFSRTGVAVEGSVSVVTMSGGCEAAIISLGASLEEVTKITALIKAAPKLLSALEALDAYVNSPNDFDRGAVTSEARLAIASARGVN